MVNTNAFKAVVRASVAGLASVYTEDGFDVISTMNDIGLSGSAIALSSTAIKIYWRASIPADATAVSVDRFRIMGYSNGNPVYNATSFPISATLGSNSVIDTGVSADTEYMYRVKVTRGDGSVEQSNYFSAKTYANGAPLPGQPGGPGGAGGPTGTPDSPPPGYPGGPPNGTTGTEKQYHVSVKLVSSGDETGQTLAGSVGQILNTWTSGFTPGDAVNQALGGSVTPSETGLPTPFPNSPQWLIQLTWNAAAAAYTGTIRYDNDPPPDDWADWEWKITADPSEIDLQIDSNNDGVVNGDDNAVEDDGAAPGEVLQVNNDDDNQNDTPDYLETGAVANEDDLVAMKLLVSPDITDGTVKLSLNSGTDLVRVWEHPDKSGSEFLGDGVNDKQWNLGSQPDTVWIETIAPTTTLGAVQFALAATPSTGPTTTGPTATDAAHGTPIKVHIVTGQAQTDVIGKTRDWLVGQMADMRATFEGPQGLGQPSYQWDVPGKTLHFYNVAQDSSKGETVPLGDHDALPQTTETAGKKDPRIQFYWYATSANAPDSNDVIVKLTFPNIVVPRSATTTFKVYTPIAAVQPVVGAVQVYANPPNSVGLFPAQGSAETGGMVWRGHVDVPPAVAALGNGTWTFAQLVIPDDHFINGNQRVHYQHNDASGLDGSFPYHNVFQTNIPNQSDQDSPHFTVAPNTLTSAIYNQTFYTTIMFKPPGADSQWVPIQFMFWKMLLEATSNGQLWTVKQGSSVVPANPSFAASDVYPEWDFVHHGSTPLVNG